jgi:hypothetical protein
MHDNLARDPLALPQPTSQRGGTVGLRLRPLRGELRAVPLQAPEQGDAAPEYDAAPDASMPALAETGWRAGALVQLVQALAAQNAQLAGQVVFLQGQAEATRTRMALLETARPAAPAAPWWRRLLFR